MSVKMRVALVVTVVVLGAAGWTLTRALSGTEFLTASGTVEATDADLGFQVPGRINTIRVRLGDAVAAGDTLATLDVRELTARLASTDAQVGAARARLDELLSGFRTEEVAQARAATRAAERRYQNAVANLNRTRTLFDGGAVSRELLERHETETDVAEADRERAVEALQLLEAGPRPEQIAAARAAVRQAEANLAVVAANLDHMIVLAPFPGRITLRHREPGEIVAPGAPVVSLTNLDDRWVRVYVREDAIGRLALGRRVELTADTYPEKTYGGEIVFIASDAEFTPSNVQTREERVTLVYEVRVRITEDESMDLKPGIAADVVLETAPR
jgi:HlyD family secretion protein